MKKAVFLDRDGVINEAFITDTLLNATYLMEKI